MSKVKHLLGISGGKDSAALALYFVRLQRSWTLLFGVSYKKIADLLLR